MSRRREVPNNPGPVSRPSCLLSYKRPSSINSLESTLPQLFIPKDLKSFRINTYTKTRGRGSRPFPHSLPRLLQRKQAPDLYLHSSVYSSKFRIPQLLCFHTLRKTAGVYLLSSQSGTRHFAGSLTTWASTPTNSPCILPTRRLTLQFANDFGRSALKTGDPGKLLRRSFCMASTVWKGHLTFGLISIPVRMTTAARSERISFNQLHKECHTRVKQPLFCPTHNRIIERSEVVKGYEYEKDQYVLFSEDELDKIEPPSARVAEILEFVKLGEVDPVYFDASYYLAPDEGGTKAYQLLMSAMHESGYAAIAKLTMHQREHIVVVRPGNKGMMLHTMFYSNEIRAAESSSTDKVELKDQEKKLAQQLIQNLAVPFEPQKYKDSYQDNVRAMIAAKLKGQEVTEVAQPHMAPVIDLMEALKKSLAERQAPAKKPPVRAVEPAAGPVAVPKKGKKAVG